VSEMSQAAFESRKYHVRYFTGNVKVYSFYRQDLPMLPTPFFKNIRHFLKKIRWGILIVANQKLIIFIFLCI
jgi:hypothetical protein